MWESLTGMFKNKSTDLLITAELTNIWKLISSAKILKLSSHKN